MKRILFLSTVAVVGTLFFLEVAQAKPGIYGKNSSGQGGGYSGGSQQSSSNHQGQQSYGASCDKGHHGSNSHSSNSHNSNYNHSNSHQTMPHVVSQPQGSYQYVQQPTSSQPVRKYPDISLNDSSVFGQSLESSSPHQQVSAAKSTAVPMPGEQRPPRSYFVGLSCAHLPDAEVYVVQSVTKHSPAEASGVLAGDLILSINGQPITSEDVLAREMNRGRLDLVILRGSDATEVTATVTPQLLATIVK